jgi:hypothetical protein
MPAILSTAPPARALADDQLYIELTTDATIPVPASVELVVSGSGPSDTETLQIEFAGNDLTFSAVAALTASALDLPLKGAETLAEYADILAERLAGCEVLHEYFSITRSSSGGELITLTQRHFALLTITVTNGLSNVAETVTDVTTTGPDNLRALVEVWEDTGTLATDTRLATLHAPYLLPAGTTALNIHAAFSTLKAHLPTTNTIAPGLVTSPLWGHATSAYLKYYLRYADKYGTPAVAESLARSEDSYYAYMGAISADSSALATTPLRHNYATRNKTTLVKPITQSQPDWMYWVCPVGVTGVYLQVQVFWSDGTESTVDPFDTDLLAVEENQLYWFATSWRSLKMSTLTPEPGSPEGTYITGYRVSLTTGGLMLGVHSVTYELRYSYFSDIYLVFSNGMGGCESVGFLGKNVENYDTKSEIYDKPRAQGWTAVDGDLALLSAEGRRTWVVNTGWHTGTDYLVHLRQLQLSDAWMIDIKRQKFLRVIVEPGEIEVNPDDETLYSLEFQISAAWKDSTANV